MRQPPFLLYPIVFLFTFILQVFGLLHVIPLWISSVILFGAAFFSILQLSKGRRYRRF